MSALTTGFTFGSSESNRTVTAARLNAAVNDATINDDAIAAAMIQDNAVTSNAINTGAVTTAKIAANAVTNSKIGAGAVDTTELADDAVTTAKIDALAVTAAELASDSVTSAKILALAVTTAKINDSAITPAKLAAAAVTTVAILDANVTADKLASDSVASGKIVAGAVTAAKLASDSVTTAKILDANVTTAKLADGSVTADKIADGTITTAKLSATVSTFPAGAVTMFFGSTVPAGRWLFANGKTIGGVSSSATALASAEAQTLFVLIWNSTADAEFPVEDSSGTPVGRGGSASADFVANRRIPLPDMRGRVGAGRDSMGNSAASRLTTATGGFGSGKNTLGASGGSETHAHDSSDMVAQIVFTEAGTSAGAMQSRGISPDYTPDRAIEFTASAVAHTTRSTGAAISGETDDAGTLQPMILCNYIIAY